MKKQPKTKTEKNYTSMHCAAEAEACTWQISFTTCQTP